MNKLWCGDCLDFMRRIPAKSVDLILTDLPYGTTAAKWDKRIPADKLWKEWKRIITPIGAVVLTCSQPFTSMLVMSNVEWFKYEWIWEKGRASGVVHAKNKPMKAHENVLVFSPGTTVHASQSDTRMNYFPQMSISSYYKRTITAPNTGELNHIPSKANLDHVGKTKQGQSRYPRSIIRVSNHNVGNANPTAKPVELMQYLILTYTRLSSTVLDCCMGSGSTGVACAKLGRDFIGIEIDNEMFEQAKHRIDAARTSGIVVSKISSGRTGFISRTQV